MAQLVDLERGPARRIGQDLARPLEARFLVEPRPPQAPQAGIACPVDHMVEPVAAALRHGGLDEGGEALAQARGHCRKGARQQRRDRASLARQGQRLQRFELLDR